MQLIFLGTASSYPTPLRGVSCTALRFNDGDIWLFDCGEGSQIQVQKSNIRMSRVTKIFITHLHGDHLFGLPGLMCTMGNQAGERPSFVLEIYGPLGLRRYIRESLNISRSELTFKYIVHELIPIATQYPDEWESWTVDHTATNSSNHPQELIGRNIEEEGHKWSLYESSTFNVYAGVVLHRVPSFGFVVCEEDAPGQLDVAKLHALKVPPGPEYSSLKRGVPLTLPSGQVIHPSEVLGPPKIGRKVTILGDTSDAMLMSSLAQDSDVLVHEATLEDSMEEKAKFNGHSTPSMAAEFARHIQAKRLILYHFSQRYKIQPLEDKGCVGQLVREAQAALNGYQCSVVAADDCMEFSIPRP